MNIQVGDRQELRFSSMDALVDTGATYLSVPKDVLLELNCTPTGRRTFALADGSIAEYDIGPVSLRLNGEAQPVLCVFADEGSEPLLGAIALETFLLAPDPVNQTLIPVIGRLM